MTRDQIIEVITQVLGDELAVLRDDFERLVAARPAPPPPPPALWTAGRYSVGSWVRHCNGIFYARRDTEREPPHEDWLPLVVGVAGLELRMSDERTLAMRARLSDGTNYELVHNIAVPIVRGYWDAQTLYQPGDRVFRYGEFHALKESLGIDPSAADGGEHWLKVGGKQKREPLNLVLDDDGTLTESGREIGSLKPMVRSLLDDLLTKHTGGAR